MNPNIKCTCPFGNPQIGIDDNCPIHGVKEHETITTAGDQPLSPKSSVGVEEKQNILDNIPLDEEGHREFFTKKEVFQAMTEYSSLMNKEKDDRIKDLEDVLNKKEDGFTQLQQLLSEKEKEINEYSLNLKNAVEQGGKLVHEKFQLQKEIEYWKQRCEAAEALIDKTGWGNDAEWIKWQQLKQSPIN